MPSPRGRGIGLVADAVRGYVVSLPLSGNGVERINAHWMSSPKKKVTFIIKLLIRIAACCVSPYPDKGRLSHAPFLRARRKICDIRPF